MHPIHIERLGVDATTDDIAQLAALIVDAVNSGAGVSFLAGLTVAEAERWWTGVLAQLTPRTVILVARDGRRIVGTVQLQPAWAPNQPHRADVAKLMVHRDARRRGVARRLMHALEQSARDHGFTVLVLDTVRGESAERLYESMGWSRVGVIPNFALSPDGTLCDTVFFYKQL